MKKYLLLLSIVLFTSKIYSACTTGFSEIIVQIIPDNYFYEVSWNITDSVGNIVAAGDSSAGDTLCVPTGTCNLFSIFDSFGDGILAPGSYSLWVDGVVITSGGSFGFGTQYSFNCAPGRFCTNPIPVTLGLNTANYDDTWYDYTPSVSGTYSLNTCSLNTCDTKIWIYSNCPTVPYQEGVQGTYAFNDSNTCGNQAVLNVMLIAGTHYLIRIGDNLNDCSSAVDFDFSYLGPIQGCTDITACNFNPLAAVDDSSCIYFPSPLCDGPDLKLDSNEFVSSLVLQSHAAQTCDVDEGCVTGYGTRWVIAFTTHIDNIGTQDFFIGNASTQPGMFNLNNCHGHDHYEGYGDYRLIDMNNNPIPAGHKNGYCVIDLCGHGQYTCGNMGISIGCFDAYGVGTQCQWIDITDVPTGDYRIAVVINSKHLPDAIGRFETNYVNNAVQICVHIVHNTGGAPSYTLLPTCTPYVDCTGLQGGTSELDCNGICNGPGVYGDMYQDAVLDSQDVVTYLDIMQSNMPVTHCNDLNRDSSLTIYDAALVNWCRRGNPLHPGGSAHNHCNFPRNVTNPADLVGLAINNVNFTDNYVDIEILNPLANVKAYQFSMSGITITSVVSLANPVTFPVDVRFRNVDNMVFGISLEDSALFRANVPQQLVRIYFSEVTDTLICINSIVDIVNQDAERTITNILGACTHASITLSVPAVLKHADLVILPNPARDKAYIHLSENTGTMSELSIMDVTGKSYTIPSQMINDTWYELDINSLPAGVYFIRLHNNTSHGVTRFVKL